MTNQTEKQRILSSIIRNGDTIVEACENADLELLRQQGDGELADLAQRILRDADEFSAGIGLYDEDLDEEEDDE